MQNRSKRYFNELYDREISQKLAQRINTLSEKLEKEKIKIMNFCGTHEHTITYYGLRDLLKNKIDLIAGPGCPVCVTPAAEIDEAIYLAKNEGTVLTYGDMYKTPGSDSSLAQARSNGANVKIVYGFKEALELAKDETDKEFVFFAVGFETTAPTVAAHVVKGTIPANLSLLISYRITVPITRYMLEHLEFDLDGIIAPGHVASITGSNAWEFISTKHHLPMIVTGFEPLDVLKAVKTILKQYHISEIRPVNEYDRVVKPEGNETAKKFISRAFQRKNGYWRGIGNIPKSIWRLQEQYADLDARKRFDIPAREAKEIKPGCKCAEVTLGKAKPTDCNLYLGACTPSHPYGPCMVSSEGTCKIWAEFGGKGLEKSLSH